MDVDRLFAEHHDALLRYLIRLTGDMDFAEDTVQETFVRLIERPPDDPARTRAWLFRVATNLVREGERTTKRRRGLLTASPQDVPGPARPSTPSRQLEIDEVRQTVRAGLATLSQRDQTVLLMREEGFTHREIAEAVNTTTNAVGVLIARALAKLTRRLGAQMEMLR